MGSIISSRRRRSRSAMNNQNEGAPPGPGSRNNETGEDEAGETGAQNASGADGEREDLATILSYLIRSGQVRILPGGLFEDDDDDDEYMEDDMDCLHPDISPKCDQHPDISGLQDSVLREQIMLQSGQHGQSGCCQGQSSDSKHPKSMAFNTTKPAVFKLLHKRELGLCNNQRFSAGDQSVVNSVYLPNTSEEVARYQQKAFCGTFSQEGNIFLSACQDRRIRIYDTSKGHFKQFKSVVARDVGWSVLDTAFSPDGNYLVYSSWSDCLHLCNIYGEHDTHDAMHLFPTTDHSFCIFSVCFSQDNRQILGGANDGCLYVFDRDKNERTLRIDAHDDDVNAVAFADASSQILFSGGDDGLCKVWDTRTLCEENPVAVGVLAGHSDGITYIDTKGDARYLISNSKDQSIKLWDIRKFSDGDTQRATKQAVADQKWDYRWQQVPKKVMRKPVAVKGDPSLMTYRGHSVLNTLIRSRFSPMHSTGQRYIYSGCASGAVIVYDVLSGQIATRLKGHRACVRDVSWHPFENTIHSTSWDSTINRWTYFRSSYGQSSDDSDSDSDSDEDVTYGKRRSLRIQNRPRLTGRSLLSRFMRN